MTTSGELAIIRDIFLMRCARKYSIPVIYHVHYGKVPEIIVQNGVQCILLKLALKLANTVIAIDMKTYSAIQEFDDRINIEYVPNSINPNEMPMYNENPAKEVTFLGWCIKTKGIEELILAWDSLEQDANWKLNLVGPYNKEYINDILAKTRKKNIFVVGELEHKEAMELLNNAAIFVLPSYTEGFPMSILEAMILGKAIVATDVGAVKEMLDDECGAVIQKKNIEQLASALNEYMINERLRKEIGTRARKRVLDKYTENVVFEQYLKCWMK